MSAAAGFTVPAAAYGARASALQGVVTEAEAIRPFSVGESVDAAKLGRLIDEHVVRMGARTSRSASWPRVEILHGPTSVLAECWDRGGEWRNLIGQRIGEMHARHADARSRERLRPPIWPLGLVNVFDPVFVANEATHRRCRDVSGSPRELDACWAAVCFIEKLVDAALVWELFGDRESTATSPFAPLLSVCASSAIPVGWTDEEFYLYWFDGGR